jgi:Ca-activated chloride channel homolog
MFKFENPYLLYFVLAIPVFWMLWYLLKKSNQKKLSNFADKNLINFLSPEKSKVKPFLKMFTFIMALLFLVFTMANPLLGAKLTEVKGEGVDIMIALDLSNSMKAQDLLPTRLEHAKREIFRFLEKIESDKIGLVIFGGDAYVQLPITTDYGAAKLFLDQIDHNIIPVQGTAIGAAIDKCVESFDKKDQAKKAIILITDGENFEDDAMGAASRAIDAGITVHCIGMGSAVGVPIPEMQGNKLIGYKRDVDGNTVITKLNETMLQQISATGKGLYVRDDNSGSALPRIIEQIGKMQKKEYAAKLFSDYDSKYQWFLLPAFLLLLLEFFTSEKRSVWWDKLNLFDSKKEE